MGRGEQKAIDMLGRSLRGELINVEITEYKYSNFCFIVCLILRSNTIISDEKKRSLRGRQ